MAANGVLVATGDWNAAAWAGAARAADPTRPVFAWPDVPDPAAIGYAMTWSPPEGFFRDLANLRVIFSLAAGVDHLVFRDDLPDVPIVRVVNPDLTERIAEWAVLQVLIHHRRQRLYDRFQRERRWHELSQPAAHEVRVGIMGMGVLGRAAAAALVQLGFQVAGWNRRGAPVEGVEIFAGQDRLDAFLARTDMLVSLLPLTPETRGILAMPLFRKLSKSGPHGLPVLINAGRGGLQVEADIVAALDAGILGGASLDVFEVEPLPPDSPLWGYDDVVITPHAAAWSSPRPLAEAILKQITAFEAGKPLENVVDRDARY